METRIAKPSGTRILLPIYSSHPIKVIRIKVMQAFAYTGKIEN